MGTPELVASCSEVWVAQGLPNVWLASEVKPVSLLHYTLGSTALWGASIRTALQWNSPS